ncbi:MAG: lysine--tRNA ligase [Candidatus Levybacteria bacterium]|nr:lysine--tRNA ligase [Candidatus Levybacteria bacterium]
MPSNIEALREGGLKEAAYLEEIGINPYPPEMPERTHMNSEVVADFDSLQDQRVAVVGRITAIRTYGKRIFFDVTDASGKIQAMLIPDESGDDSQLQLFRKGFGVGDFVGVSGNLMKTRTGEVTVDASGLTMLAKSLLPIPEKLRDIEIRSRKRYLDLLVNPEVLERFKFRSRMVDYMRRRFQDLGCYEVETPVLDTTYGGAAAKPFTTYHNTLETNLFLRISNELYLKRLIAGGFEGVFEFSRDFRNEGMDRTHNPEFTQVELYKAYTDYNWMMDTSEQLMSGIAQDLAGSTHINYMGRDIDFSTPWRRLSMYDGIREAYGFDPETASEDEVRRIALDEGIEGDDVGYLLVELFDKRVAPTLINPTFVIDYPESTSPLTKKHRTKPGLVERFECYVDGMEVMNCYTELNDPRKQRENFEAELRRRSAGDEEAMLMDDDFVIAMEYGMPPMGGIGISIDRFTMIFTNAEHIREVILFPTMKPKQR